jgi:predicted enzyme related to lactoylglutathione lyase
MPIQDVTVVSVPVADQERSKAFFVNQLGFSLLRDDSSIPGLRWITVAPGGGRVALTLVNWFETMPAGSLRGLVLNTPDLAAEHDALAARGVVFEQPPAHQPWGYEAVFVDPDGNSFVLQQAQS